MSFNGSTILIALAAAQAFGVMRGLRRTDYLDHLVGMMVGYASAQVLQKNAQKRQEADRSMRLGSWWESVLGKGK